MDVGVSVGRQAVSRLDVLLVVLTWAGIWAMFMLGYSIGLSQ